MRVKSEIMIHPYLATDDEVARQTRLESSVRLKGQTQAPEGFDLRILEGAPLVEGWWVYDDPDWQCQVIRGSVSGHPHYGEIRNFQSSPLIWLDADFRCASCQSRFYRLGAPKVSTDD